MAGELFYTPARVRSSDDGGFRLQPPSTQRANLVRRRLLERARGRFKARVMVVVAPAGFGKTTLLSQAVTENQLQPLGTDVWLTCCEDDAAGSSLAQGLCQALGVDPPRDIDDAINKLVEVIWHHAPKELAFVLDDVHEIHPDSRGAEFLAGLMAATPRNGHFVLVGRQPPPVPLARLEVAGQVLHLDQSDLLFDPDELAEFASERGVPGGQVARSGGWPALAEMAASSVREVEIDYLWAEVLSRIPAGRRHDLALLAHVGSVDDALATAVLGRDVDVSEVTAGLPLVVATLDGCHQIHPLWQPHLAREVSPDSIATARRRAGIELARVGHVNAAVRFLTDAGAWDLVTDLVTDVLSVPDPRMPGDLVEMWLDRLPTSMKDGPLAQLLGAVAGAWTDPVATRERLEDAAIAFRHDGSPAAEVACMMQLARLAWVYEQPERLVALAVRLFELEEAGYDQAEPLAHLARAGIAMLTGNWEGVITELDCITWPAPNPPLRCLADWLRAISLNYLGRPSEALRFALQASDAANPLPVPAADGVRIQSLWLLGRVDDVVEELPMLSERVSATGLKDFTAYTLAMASYAAALTGRIEEAREYLDRARRVAPTSPAVPMVDANLAVAEAELAIASGDDQHAALALREYLTTAPPVGTGMAAVAQYTSLPAWYVSAPETRASWDQARLGPCFVIARSLARSMVAVQATGRLPSGTAPLPEPNVVRSLLPVPWATELALAHIAAGDASGWSLLEALWPVARTEVRRHARQPRGPLRPPARTVLARLPVPPPGHLDLRLLGPVELRRDDVLVENPEWRRDRVRSLLAYLVLRRTVSRERLAGDLWPTLGPDAQAHNLRVNLAHLLRVLEPDRDVGEASFLVRSHGRNLLLHDGEWLRTDVWQYDKLWERALEADQQGAPSEALDAMRRAIDLWRDDPSELAGNDWALPEVEERRLRFVRLATRAGELLLARDDPETARHMGERALQVDPCFEGGYGVVVAAHLAVGNRQAARTALERYRHMLTDLGLEPEASSDLLQKLRLLAQSPAD